MPKLSSKILYQTQTILALANPKMTKSLLYLRSLTGEKCILIAFSPFRSKEIALLPMLFRHLELQPIASAKLPRSQSASQPRKSSTVINPTINAKVDMFQESSIGERERDSSQNLATPTPVKKESVKRIIWRPMNAESTMLSTESLITAWLQMKLGSRRKCSRMDQ